MSTRKPLLAVLGLTAALLIALAVPAGAQAAFGIAEVKTEARNADGSVDLRAGSHPYEYKVEVEMNQDAGGKPEGTLRELIVDLPAGMAGNPQALPRCSATDFEGQVPRCPPETQIGVAHIQTANLPEASVPIYNLTPPLGVAASIGFTVVGFNSFQEGSVRPGAYNLRVSDITVPTALEITKITETIWGVPMEPGHDAERGFDNAEGTPGSPPIPSETDPEAFLSLPTSCAGPLETTVSVVSVQEPDNPPAPKAAKSLAEGGLPAGLTGCDRPPFAPTISAQPETTTADSPTGLNFHLHVPQSTLPEAGDPEGTATATAHLKDAFVTLPAGLAVNPSTADGLEACSLAQIELGGSNPPNCPAASQIGTVEVKTPLLDHPLPGAVYIARQGENPFGSLIALYIVIDDPITGVVVKLAGKIEPDPATGQLRTAVRQNPQLPFEELSFHFFGGPRASLTTPPTCGTYNTTAELVPWSAPEGPTRSAVNSFAVNSAPGGGACAQSEAQMPNAPAFEAGTTSPLAGTYAPFVLKLTRGIGSQRLGALNLTLPPGLSAKLAGTAECSEAQIAAATARSGPGEGALEEASPSCPAASEIGVVNVGAGSGTPIYVPGHAYLAGPYKGAPLSMAIITPAVAGPFDLGVVVVRAALFVDESSAQVTVKSDPIPQILQGIPLQLRSIAVKVDRSQFILNPTSCEAMAVGGQAISTTGAVAALSNRFQVGGCVGLGFAPKLALKFSGGTKRTKHPGLRAVLTQPEGQANIAQISFTLPSTEFVDPEHVSNPCTRPQFKEGKCPPASVLGKVRAFSPLLEAPLEGPIYFRSNGGERELPDAVADLNGQIHLLSVGFLDSLHHKGSEESRLRTKIAVVPDAPISKVVIALNSGKEKGLLVNSQNLCKTKVSQRAIVKLTGQNGKTHNSEPLIANSCGKSQKAKRRHRSS